MLTSSTDTVGSCCLSVCHVQPSPAAWPWTHLRADGTFFLPTIQTVQDLIIQSWHNLWVASFEQIKCPFSPCSFNVTLPSYAPWLLAISTVRRKDFLQSPFCAHVYTPPHANCIGKQYPAQSSQHFSSIMQPCHQKSVCFAHVTEPYNNFGLQQNFGLFRS